MRFFKRSYMTLIMLFLYAPIVLMIVFSFNAGRSRGLWGGFSLQWYAELLNDRQILTALRNTLVIGLLAAAISTVIGGLGAIGLFQLRRKGLRQAMLSLVNLPMLNSEIVTGVSLLMLYAAMRMELGFFTLLLSHVAFCIPYVVLSVLPKLRQLDPHLAEAAQDLGATPLKAFYRVILPDIMPGVFSGFLLALTLSIDDFVISFFTTGMGVSNLSITIYTMARRGISPKLNALSAVIFLVVLALLIIVNLPNFRQQNKKTRKEIPI
jgi:spermidine/putrescine transport system permease protein